MKRLFVLIFVFVAIVPAMTNCRRRNSFNNSVSYKEFSPYQDMEKDKYTVVKKKSIFMNNR